MNAMKELCEARYEAFGATRMASKIRPLALDAMARRCERSALDPQLPDIPDALGARLTGRSVTREAKR